MPDAIVELRSLSRDRMKIGLAGGRFFIVPNEQTSQLCVGAVLSDEEIRRIDRMDQYFRGKNKALLLLSKRSRARREIASALEAMSIESAICGGIVSELEEAGLIDDVRFTREYVRVKTDVRGFGPYRLRRDLTRLGVRKSIVDTVLGESFDEDTQLAMAREQASRRAREKPVGEREARRIADFLKRKGFDYEVVNEVVYDLLRRQNEHEPG